MERQRHLEPQELLQAALGELGDAEAARHASECTPCLDLRDRIAGLAEALQDEPSDERRRSIERYAEDEHALLAAQLATTPGRPGLILAALAFPAPLDLIASSRGISRVTLDDAIAELRDRLRGDPSDLLGAAKSSVAHVIGPEEWKERDAEPAPQHAVGWLASRDRERPLSFSVTPTFVSRDGDASSYHLDVEELQRDSAWYTSFRLQTSGEVESQVREVRWRFYFLPEDEAEALASRHPQVPDLHLAALRAAYGEGAWRDLLDRLILHRAGSLTSRDAFECEIPGRLPGRYKFVELLVLT